MVNKQVQQTKPLRNSMALQITILRNHLFNMCDEFDVSWEIKEAQTNKWAYVSKILHVFIFNRT